MGKGLHQNGPLRTTMHMMKYVNHADDIELAVGPSLAHQVMPELDQAAREMVCRHDRGRMDRFGADVESN